MRTLYPDFFYDFFKRWLHIKSNNMLILISGSIYTYKQFFSLMLSISKAMYGRLLWKMVKKTKIVNTALIFFLAILVGGHTLNNFCS